MRKAATAPIATTIGARAPSRAPPVLAMAARGITGFHSQGRLVGDDGKFGTEDMGPADLVEHVRRAIQSGIEEERRLPGENRKAGGTAEVVLVGRAGARFVSRAAMPRRYLTTARSSGR